MERLDVFRDGERTGELCWSEDGLYLCLELCCGLRQDGIYRAFAVGERGELPLGVLEPVSGALRLRRRLARRELAQIGPLLRGEMRLPGEGAEARVPEGWRVLGTGEEFFRGGPFRGELRGVTGALWQQQGQFRLLALPFDNRRPFLLASLFCFARVQRINGREYAVFAFDGQEYPVFLPWQ